MNSICNVHGELRMHNKQIHRLIRPHFFELIPIAAMIDRIIMGSVSTVDLKHEHIIPTYHRNMKVMIANVDFDADSIKPEFSGVFDNDTTGIPSRNDRFSRSNHGIEKRLRIMISVTMGNQ